MIRKACIASKHFATTPSRSAAKTKSGVLAIVVAGFFCACGDGHNVNTAPVAHGPVTTAVSIANNKEKASLADDIHIRGSATSISDVSGLPDTAITRGAILCIPETRIAALLDNTGVNLSDPGRGGYASFQLQAMLLPDLSARVANINADGTYDLELAAGTYLVCLADTFPDHTPGPPYAIVGCDLTEFGADATFTVSYGEGGVEVTLD